MWISASSARAVPRAAATGSASSAGGAPRPPRRRSPRRRGRLAARRDGRVAPSACRGRPARRPALALARIRRARSRKRTACRRLISTPGRASRPARQTLDVTYAVRRHLLSGSVGGQPRGRRARPLPRARRRVGDKPYSPSSRPSRPSTSASTSTRTTRRTSSARWRASRSTTPASTSSSARRCSSTRPTRPGPCGSSGASQARRPRARLDARRLRLPPGAAGLLALDAHRPGAPL